MAVHGGARGTDSGNNGWTSQLSLSSLHVSYEEVNQIVINGCLTIPLFVRVCLCVYFTMMTYSLDERW